MKTVLVFGTFDKLHQGHRWFLTAAKQHGDRLVVIIARDHNVDKVKGHRPTQSEAQRLEQVQAVLEVDEARLGLDDYAKKEEIIKEIKPNVICLGYDQAPKFQSPDPTVQVVRLEAFHPEIYKSSKL